VADNIERRVLAYGDVLYGVHGLCGGSRRVTAAEFHASHEAHEVGRRYPGVKAVGFAELVGRGELVRRSAQIRRDVRASGLPYPRFEVRPEPQGARAAPVAYIEPQRGNERAIGQDLLSEPRRRAALKRTLRSGRPEATAPVRLVQDSRGQPGLLVLLATETRTANRWAWRTRPSARTTWSTGSCPPETRAARLALYDVGATGERVAPLDAAERLYGDGARRDRYGSRTVDFDLMGRRWALRYAPNHSLARPDQALLNWLPLIAGAALAALAAWLLGASLRTERRAVALAERMTLSLRASEAELARSNAELERFASVASHDLREPLRTITGFLGLLGRRHRAQLDDEGRELVALAVQGARRMDALIAELLECSRTGHGPASNAPADLDVAWCAAVNNLSAAIAEAEAEVTSGPLPSSPPIAARCCRCCRTCWPTRSSTAGSARRTSAPRRCGAAPSGMSPSPTTGPGSTRATTSASSWSCSACTATTRWRAPAWASRSARRSSSATAAASGSSRVPERARASG